MLQSEEPAAELGGRVLLAEDGPDNQVLIASLLRKRGVDVTVVENSRLALERVLTEQRAGNPYDLVLMDMQMPELGGYRATAQQRKKGYQGAIVALTEHAMAGERASCLAAGCDDYLTKPIERSTLLSARAPHQRAANRFNWPRPAYPPGGHHDVDRALAPPRRTDWPHLRTASRILSSGKRMDSVEVTQPKRVAARSWP